MTASSMGAMASETLDLVTHDNARPASPALFLVGNVTMTYGELAKSVSEYETALRRDDRAVLGFRAGTALATRVAERSSGDHVTEDETVPAAIGIAAAVAAEVPVVPLNPATPPAERAGKVERWRLALQHENGATRP